MWVWFKGGLRIDRKAQTSEPTADVSIKASKVVMRDGGFEITEDVGPVPGSIILVRYDYSNGRWFCEPTMTWWQSVEISTRTSG